MGVMSHRQHTKIPVKGIFSLLPFCIFAIFLLTLLSCDGSDTRFKLSGKFKNMNQAELYLVNMEKGTNDTLHVVDGRFTYETALNETATLTLIFPNFSELPVIAEPGHSIDIDGDASHLKATTVKGSESNELMTAFRLKTNDMMPPDIIKEAEAYISKHAESPVANYLLQRYYLMAIEPDYPKAYELCTLIHDAQPSQVSIIQLLNQLEALKEIRTTGKLPDFKATDTKGQEVSNATQKSEVNVICLWASWNYASQAMLRNLRLLQKTYPEKLSIISVSVDGTPEDGRQYLERDSLTNPNVCDGLLWESPMISQLGLAYIPDNIVTDSTGTILARNLSNDKLKEKVEQLLK